MKQNSVKRQYCNKVTFLQLSAYKTNQQTSICLLKSQNNKKKISKNTSELPDLIKQIYIKGPRKAVLGYKITLNCFKTTYRSVLTFKEKKQSYYSLV